MNNAQKINALRVLLDDGSGYAPSNETLNTYLNLSESEILSWMYHLIGGVPEEINAIPAKYENVQIYAIVAGWTHAGAEGQSVSIENGVHRHFEYTDMLDYIHNNVLPFVRVGAVSST